MSSVTPCEAMLNEPANVLAKETGCIQHERKLTGATFVQVMALGHLHQPEATLEQLTQDAQVCGVQFSASELHQRCTKSAATFLQAVADVSATTLNNMSHQALALLSILIASSAIHPSLLHSSLSSANNSSHHSRARKRRAI